MPNNVHRAVFVPLASLVAASLLTACGGGGSDTPAPTVQVTVSAQAQPSGVYDILTPITVQAQVRVNAVAAADNTVVNLSLTGGGFTPAAPGTRGGTATTTLTASTPGVHTLQASTVVSGITATGSQTLILRPAPTPVELMVPAYFTPGSGTGWAQLAAAAATTPAVRITAILNPSNGIFTSANSQFLQASRNLVASGGSVIGYVYTRYGSGARSLADIKTNIDRYLDLYGRGVISGIFLDEMASDVRQLDFYREIYNYIKAKDATLRVVGNPGTVPPEAFAAVADQLVTFEGTASQYQAFDPRVRATWLNTQANARQAALVHDALSCTDMQTAARAAVTGRYNAGVFYATNLQFDAVTGVGNPWASLPSYWSQLVATIHALNTGAPSLPTC